MALLEARRRDGRQPATPKAHYSFIVQHLFEQGRVEEGFRYLEALAAPSSSSTRLDGRCYAILAGTLLERGQAEAAAALLLGDMRRRRVTLCKEVGPVLVALARALPAREREARALLNEAVKAAVLPSHAAEALWASVVGPPIEAGGARQQQGAA